VTGTGTGTVTAARTCLLSAKDWQPGNGQKETKSVWVRVRERESD